MEDTFSAGSKELWNCPERNEEDGQIVSRTQHTLKPDGLSKMHSVHLIKWEMQILHV